MYPYLGYLTPWYGYCPFSVQPAEKTNKEDDEHKYRCMDEENRLDEDKQSTALASETPEVTMQGHIDKVYKDDFVPGFVPNHNHGSVDYTSVEEGHVHQCLDIL